MKKILSFSFAAALSLMLMVVTAPSALGASSGPNNGSAFTGNVSAPSGDHDWSNASNAATSNNSYATVAISSSSNVSNYLRATGFGFSIPAGSTINGITVEIERSEAGTQSATIRDNIVSLVKNNVVTGSNKAATSTNWPTSDAIATYGGVTDLWGSTWSYSDVNNANFGVVLSVGRTSGGDEQARVDHIKVTINYTAPVVNNATITIIKDTVPNDAQDFAFTTTGGGLSSFSLDDDADGTLSNTKTFTSLAAGAYSVTEGLTTGWSLTNLVCVDPTTNSTVDIGTRTATINLAAGETVTCTFTNTDSSAPTLTSVTPVPSPSGNLNPSFTFNSTEAGSIAYSGACGNGSLASAVAGDNTVTFGPLSAGVYNDCSLSVTDGNGNTSSNLSINTFSIDQNLFEKGLVSLSFDDGWKSIYNEIGRLNSFKSTQYIYTGPVFCAEGGAFCTDFMSPSDVATLFGAGHEIGSHTRSHYSLPTLEGAELAYEVDGSRLDLLSELAGVPVDNLAYPLGELDADTIAQLKQAGYLGARTVFPDELNTKSSDRFELWARQVNADTTVAEVESWIDEAISESKWLILVFHQIVDTCTYPDGIGGSDPYCTLPANLSAIVTYLESKGSTVEVVTVGEGLALMDGHASTGSLAPIITQTDIMVEATSSSGAEVEFAPTVVDPDAGSGTFDLAAFCTGLPMVNHPIYGVDFPTVFVSGQLFPIGVTTLNCSSADVAGNIGSHSFTITVTDGAPVIVGTPTDFAVEATSSVGAEVSYDLPTATDAVDGEVTVICLPESNTTFGFGATLVTCTATDSALHTTQTTFTVTVADTLAPALVLTGDNPMTIELGSGPYVELGATATDVVSGDLTAGIVITGADAVDTNTIGTYIVSYDVVDGAGNASHEERTVNVTDTIAPVITINSAPAEQIKVVDATVEFSVDDSGAIVTCSFDGSEFSACTSPQELLGLSEGPHSLVIKAVDGAGNEDIETVNFVVDLTAPIVSVNNLTTNDTTPTLTGSTENSTDTVSVTVNGNEYEAVVDESGNWSVDVTEELVDGEHVVSVVSTDLAGNVSGIVEGTLTINTQAPDLAINQPAINDTVITGTTELEATVSVNINGTDYPAVIDEAGNWIVSVPEGLLDGEYLVTATSTDLLGNIAEVDVTLVIDHTAPVVTLLGDSEVDVNLNDVYLESGATASDNLGPAPVVEIGGDTVDTSVLGAVYTVTYTATDHAGNVSDVVTRTVRIKDLEGPVLSLVGASPLNLPLGGIYTELGATGIDNVDESVTVEIGGDTVDTSTLGEYTVTYNATDSSGNAAVEIVRVVVVSDLVISEEQSADSTTTSITVTWTTSHGATSRVVYDTVSHDPVIDPAPNYGYAFSTVEDSSLVTFHSVIISGLDPNTTYYFRPVSHGSPEVVGLESSLTTQTQSSGGGGGGGGSGSAGNHSGQVLGDITGAHPNGTLILDGQTIYLIKNNQRFGFRDANEYQSHGYRFDQAVPANDVDRTLPFDSANIVRALPGSLVLDASDGKTVYMIGQNNTKRGFTSAQVFNSLGYTFKDLLSINLSDYATGTPISTATESHPEGALVLNGGTVWWMLGGNRQGFSSEAVYNTYGFSWSKIVSSNNADMSAPVGPLVKFRDGTLVRSNGSLYIISDGLVRAFGSQSIFDNLGYKSTNLIDSSLSDYQIGNPIN